MSEREMISSPERAEKVKTKMTAVVPTEGLEDTGSVDFMFMVTAGVPRESCVDRLYGVLKRQPKPKDFVNPFQIGRRDKHDDPATDRWQICLGMAGHQMLAGGVDADNQGQGLDDLLTNIPDCVVMVPPEDIEALHQTTAVDLETVFYPGHLTTSNK